MIRFEPERCMKNNEGHDDERGKKKDATQRLTAYLYKHCTQIRKCKQTYSIRWALERKRPGPAGC